LAPIIAVAILSLVYSMTLFVLLGALESPVPDADPVATLVPGAVYDAVLAVLIGPLVVAVHDRAVETERVDW
jgi:hypothetical protein